MLIPLIQILALALPAWYMLGTLPSHFLVWDQARPYVFIVVAPIILTAVVYGLWLMSIGSLGYWILVAVWWLTDIPIWWTNYSRQ